MRADLFYIFIFQDLAHLELWDSDKGQGIRIGAQLVQEGWASSLLDEEVEHIQRACKLHTQSFQKQDPSIDNQNSASACTEKVVVVGNANTSCSIKVSEVLGSCSLNDKHLKSSEVNGFSKTVAVEVAGHTSNGLHSIGSSPSFLADKILDSERKISNIKSSLSKKEYVQQDLSKFEVQETLEDPVLLTKLSELFATVFKLQVYKMLQDGNKRCSQPTESTSTTILPVGSSNISTNEVQPKEKSTYCARASEYHLSHSDGNEMNSLEVIQAVNTVNELSSLEDIHSSGIGNEAVVEAIQSTDVGNEPSSPEANKYTGMAGIKCHNTREDIVLQCTDVANESLMCQNFNEEQISGACNAGVCHLPPLVGSPPPEHEVFKHTSSNVILPVPSSSVTRSLAGHLGLSQHVNHTSEDKEMSAKNLERCLPPSLGHHVQKEFELQSFDVTKCKQETCMATDDILPRCSSPVLRDPEPNSFKLCELKTCPPLMDVNSNNHQSEASQYAVNSNTLKSAPSQHTQCSAREDTSFTGLECLRDVCLPEPSSEGDGQHLAVNYSVKEETDEIFYSDV